MEIKASNIKGFDLLYLKKPLIFFTVSLVVFAFITAIGLSQISQLKDKFEKTDKVNTALLKKISILRDVDESISADGDFVNAALPDDNTSIYFISQIKSSVSENGLSLSNIKVSGSADSEGLKKTGVSFDIEGETSKIIDFFNKISKSLPISNLTKIKSNFSGDISRSSFNVNVFSSKLPEKLPSLESAISTYSVHEKQLLEDLKSYNLPMFIKIDSTPQTSFKENPFN